jgi:glutamate dehydrogenase/leucine dehydrogenase
VEEACKFKRMSVRGASVAIQGYGNVGAATARLFAEKKAKIVAISDSRGGVYNPRGIDPLKASRYKDRSGTVVGMPGAARMSNEDLLALKCDILIPAGLEHTITLHNADQIKARMIAEGANGPTTPHADEVLARKGVFVLPDILANAGGVTVSYFEWVQNLQGAVWTAAEVSQKLESVMRRAFEDVLAAMRKHHTHPRAAAYVLAVGRVADATLVRGLFP